jgi:hypothetical protein
LRAFGLTTFRYLSLPNSPGDSQPPYYSDG